VFVEDGNDGIGIFHRNFPLRGKLDRGEMCITEGRTLAPLLGVCDFPAVNFATTLGWNTAPRETRKLLSLDFDYPGAARLLPPSSSRVIESAPLLQRRNKLMNRKIKPE